MPVEKWRSNYFVPNAPKRLLTDDLLAQFSALNKETRMERTAEGHWLIMPCVGGTLGHANIHLTTRLYFWNEEIKERARGIAFSSCIGYHLPNGAVRSPDASWVSRKRWKNLTKKQKKGFPPLCPDFVAEFVGPPQGLPEMQDKMREWLENGTRLGWLINPQISRVEIYRPDQEVEVLDSPATLSGEDVLPGFMLDLTEIL